MGDLRRIIMATELQEHLLTRRLNEIFAYTNANKLTVDLSTEETSWELETLLNTGVVHKVAELSATKSTKQFLNDAPPLFEIPNESRMPYEYYYDEEEFSEENFIHEENLNVEFDDPYSNLNPWRREEGAGDIDRRWPEYLPVFLDDGDGNAVESNYHRAQGIDGVEALAWYAPMSISTSGWGIFIRRGAAAHLAEHRFSEVESRYDAWMLAMKVLVSHEYFHYLSQYHCDRLAVDMPKENKYLSYFEDWMKNPKDGVEEAIANAFALSKLTKSEKKPVERWFDDLPHPYSGYIAWNSSEDLKHGKAHLAAQQEYFGTYLDDEVNPSTGGRYDIKPTVPVPIFIVDDSHPDSPGPKMVSFAEINIHSRVEKLFSKNKIDRDIQHALQKFVNEIQGQTFQRLNLHGCKRTKDKRHWRFELPRKYRGYITQLENRNGWCIVHVGPHNKYDKYADKHGLRC